MSDIAIKVENLSKRYRIGLEDDLPDTMVGALTGWLRAPLANFRGLHRLSHFSENGRDAPDVIWALKDVSFEVKQGEVVGIIGRNGAGKSTLLKILSRITEPTSGRAVINGRVSSLLEVGTGFHPELTGRENVYLNGTVLGMRKAEIDRKFDEIVDFSGVEKFIDTPVKRYSSGMQVRLAFSVAAHLEPEILFIDEVLAVGDAEFQKKCLGKMGEVAKEGRTVLFVSHNMGAIANLSNKGLLLQLGQNAFFGDVTDALKTYSASIEQDSVLKSRRSEREVYVRSARIIGASVIETGQKLSFEAVVWSNKIIDISLDWRVTDDLGIPLILGCPHVQYGHTDRLELGNNTFMFTIGPLPLAEGDYRISLDVDVPWVTYLDRVEDCLQFSVRSGAVDPNGHSVRNSWRNGSIVIPFVMKVNAEFHVNETP